MNIHQTARFQVKADHLEECQATIAEFVAYVHANEPGTLLYNSLRQKDDPTRFLHTFIFRDEAAREIHASSDGVKRFTDILYPRLVAPVEFTEYSLIASTQTTDSK